MKAKYYVEAIFNGRIATKKMMKAIEKAAGTNKPDVMYTIIKKAYGFNFTDKRKALEAFMKMQDELGVDATITRV